MKVGSDSWTQIHMENRRRERRLSKYACMSHRGQRKQTEAYARDAGDIRPIFARDADRIIHSRACARYIDKTQAFYLFENDHITHRVLHVQFVSKIGRTIGRALRLNEDLIEAIALGHDLGHVPYGHDGEGFLDGLCRKHGIGGFAHNVQSVRCLMQIENKGQGLNPSLQVLDGIMAHNGEIIDRVYAPRYAKTWEQFEEEYRLCSLDGQHSKKVHPMTIEGCVVRISDVIAYIGRDIEDAVALDLVRRSDIPSAVTGILGNTNRSIIDRLVTDLIRQSYGKDHLEFSDGVYTALKELMQFNLNSIYLNRGIRSEGAKIEHMFEHLFDVYVEDLRARRSSSVITKHFLRDMENSYLKTTPKPRIAADFIAGMTDDYFNNQYKERFVPKSLGYSVKRQKRP